MKLKLAQDLYITKFSENWRTKNIKNGYIVELYSTDSIPYKKSKTRDKKQIGKKHLLNKLKENNIKIKYKKFIKNNSSCRRAIFLLELSKKDFYNLFKTKND